MKFGLVTHFLFVFSVPLRAAVLVDLPNSKQTDRSMDCAPVAAANSLYWLSLQGYEELAPKGSEEKSILNLVEALATQMKTREMKGTFPNRFLIGIEKYVKEKGYVIKRLEYKGSGHYPDRFGKGHEAPELPWLQSASLLAPPLCWS